MRQNSILDQGLASLCASGDELAQAITGNTVMRRAPPLSRGGIGADPTASSADQGKQWFLLTPFQVKESITNLNASVVALDSDIAVNVKRPEFLSGWKAFKDAWDAFRKDNDSLTSLLLHGTGAVWRQAEEYRKQLAGWRERYQTETNLAPSGPLPVPPGPGVPPKPPEEPTNWWIWILGFLAVGGVGLYAYWRITAPTRKRVQDLSERIGMAYLTGGGSEAARRLTNEANAARMRSSVHDHVGGE